MSALAFVDTETTGLDPDRHEIWELCLSLRRDGKSEPFQTVWHLPVDLSRADAIALTVGRFYERRVYGGKQEGPLVADPKKVAHDFARLTHGAHLVAAVPSFDAAFLTRFLRANGACPGWHYHLVDVEALAAGHIGWPPPWKSDDLSRAVGVDPEQFDRHTALGDACWAEAIYDAVMQADR